MLNIFSYIPYNDKVIRQYKLLFSLLYLATIWSHDQNTLFCLTIWLQCTALFNVNREAINSIWFVQIQYQTSISPTLQANTYRIEAVMKITTDIFAIITESLSLGYMKYYNYMCLVYKCISFNLTWNGLTPIL